MINIISPKHALRAMIALLAAVILFHVLVFIQVIPYSIVWAGKLKNVQEMMVFESISIMINLFLFAVMLVKGNYINNRIPVKIINGVIWVFVAIYALNTIGNLFSETNLELFVFTPLTFISSFLCWQAVIENKRSKAVA